MGPLSLGGNGHEDEQEPKLKIKKIYLALHVMRFLSKKEAN